MNDPLHSFCFLNAVNTDGFYESSPIVVCAFPLSMCGGECSGPSQYSQYVPQDTAQLIQLQGGADAFVKRLNFIFNEVS